MRPDISIIIPHLNQHEALTQLLASLDAQDAGDVLFEIIVADNGSRAPLPAAITRRPGLHVVKEDARGPGPARNAGVAVARGAILAFTDCDCIADPGWVAAIARHFARPGAAPVIGGEVSIAPRGARLDAIEAYESIFGYRQHLYIERDRYAATCNLAMRRVAFDTVGGFGGLDLAEDRDWGLRAHAMGITHQFVPEVRIFTSARRSFAELARKWDRQVSHEYAFVRSPVVWLRWVVRAAAVAASPLIDIPLVARSSRLTGARGRLLAFWVLVRIRLYRALRMLYIAVGGDRQALVESWRK
jgi:glycosyltransferase involved in cell wall biosynthesis